jgi:hypothetical protein
VVKIFLAIWWQTVAFVLRAGISRSSARSRSPGIGCPSQVIRASWIGGHAHHPQWALWRDRRDAAAAPSTRLNFVLAVCLFSGQAYKELARLLTHGVPVELPRAPSTAAATAAAATGRRQRMSFPTVRL